MSSPSNTGNAHDGLGLAEGKQGARILVIEDDASLSDIVCSFLNLHGYRCTAAFSGTEALLAAGLTPPSGTHGVPFDLILCDLMLPGMSGENVIRSIRSCRIEVPIVVLSAKGALDDRVSVLRMGANDYLVKPFEFEELLARIEVQLRATPISADAVGENEGRGVLTFGLWTANLDGRTLTADGRPVQLTRTEFDIVCLLMKHPGRAFSRSELLSAVSGDGELRDDKTARAHIGNIRAKLKPTGTDGYIETVWGFGFRLASMPPQHREEGA